MKTIRWSKQNMLVKVGKKVATRECFRQVSERALARSYRYGDFLKRSVTPI